MVAEPRITAPDDGPYVNYLPAPASHRRLLRVVVPAALWMGCVVMFLWARTQQDPGPAVWDDGAARSFEGTIVARPYPMLVTDHGAVLLVESGKVGARDVSTWAGRRCRVSGWLLTRDGRRMIELEPGSDAVMDLGAPGAPPAVRDLGMVLLRGEIVDAKCYLGAMKPGSGRPHKECATLCVTGGIPPVFVGRGADGAAVHALLSGADGGPIDPALLPLVADLLDVRGRASEIAGLVVLRVGPGDVRRVTEETGEPGSASNR